MKNLLVIIAFVLLGCNRTKQRSKNIFHYNETTGIATLDPAYAKNQSIMWPVHQLFSTLVEVDQQMQLQPMVAKSWVFSQDKKSITFWIRDDVYFHDSEVFPNGKGRRLVASDVVYSFNRLLDAKTASPGAWIFNGKVDTIAPFKALDDTTFVLQLQKPFYPILGILSMQYCSIVPKEAVEFYGKDFRRNPVGTGPFQFVDWKEGQALVLAKNQHYFQKDSMGESLPYLDGVVVHFYESKATEFLEFRQARLDFLNDVDPVFKDELLTKTGNLKKEWQPRLNLQKHPYLNTEYLGILSDTNSPIFKNSPLKDIRMRQAINYAIDKKKMILYLRNSIGTAAEAGFVPVGLSAEQGISAKGYVYDFAMAKNLVQAAGYDDKNPMPEIKLLTVPTYSDLATFICGDLQKAGINVKPEVMQKSLLLEQTSKGNALFFRGSWIADYPDAENYMSVFYGANPAPPNYTRFHNEKFDGHYLSAMADTGKVERSKKFSQMDSIILSKAFIVPLWYDMVLHFSHKNIENFKPNALNMLELRWTKKH